MGCDLEGGEKIVDLYLDWLRTHSYQSRKGESEWERSAMASGDWYRRGGAPATGCQPRGGAGETLGEVL